MNGRIYDPLLGRFLSADPVIQDPLNLQNFNRYTYVWNNPLRYTDPTGYRGANPKIVKRLEHIRAAKAMRSQIRHAANGGGQNAQAAMSRLQSGQLQVVLFDGAPELQRTDPDGNITGTTSGGGAAARNLSDGTGRGMIGMDSNIDSEKITTTLIEEVRETMPENHAEGGRASREADSIGFAEGFSQEAGLPPHTEISDQQLATDQQFKKAGLPAEHNVQSARATDGTTNTTFIKILVKALGHADQTQANDSKGATGNSVPSTAASTAKDTVTIVGPGGSQGTDVRFIFQEEEKKSREH